MSNSNSIAMVPMAPFDLTKYCFEIDITAAIQAGDVFLLKFKCHKCKNDNLSTFPFSECQYCHIDISDCWLDEPDPKKIKYLVGSLRKVKGGLGKKKILALYLSQDRQCAYCYQYMEKYHVEHILPICCGGTNNYTNLVLSCARCNHLAAGKFFKSFSLKQVYIINKRKASP